MVNDRDLDNTCLTKYRLRVQRVDIHKPAFVELATREGSRSIKLPGKFMGLLPFPNPQAMCGCRVPSLATFDPRTADESIVAPRVEMFDALAYVVGGARDGTLARIHVGACPECHKVYWALGESLL